MDWNHSQQIETDWWGDCSLAYQEEVKQEVYARCMEIPVKYFDGKMAYDGGGKSILDIGCGPASLLIKTVNTKQKYALDPITYPAWVEQRYKDLNITRIRIPAEELSTPFSCDVDEVWIYNVLQHVQDPSVILQKINHIPNIRILEWINFPTNAAHPHFLTKSFLDEQLKTDGNVIELNGEKNCYGLAYCKFIQRG